LALAGDVWPLGYTAYPDGSEIEPPPTPDDRTNASPFASGETAVDAVMVSRNAVSPSPIANFADARVLVIGLGRFGGGAGVTRWLAEQGARVTVTDQADATSLAESVHELDGLGVTFHLGGHDLADLDGCDLAIVNPAVNKSRSEFFQALFKRGIPWTTELNLFCERCPAPVVGVTGSFGKSTTCAMLAEVLSAWHRSGSAPFSGVHLGGNIGRSLLNDLSLIQPSDVVVLEISNAQLEDVPRIGWAPDVAVITNIHPHHLDRYDGFDSYIAAKLNILGVSPEVSRGCPWLAHGRGDRPSEVIVGDLHPLAESALTGRLGGRSVRVTSVAPFDPPLALRVPGRHNQINAACAASVCQRLRVDAKLARDSLAQYRGLPHRLEFVRSIKGVDFYNDSKSTAPSATIVALESFDQRVVAIVGGQRKGDVGYDDCARVLAQRCRAVVCTGECGPDFARALAAHGVTCQCFGTLPDAIGAARSLAGPGDVVLFSPGAPSFDEYTNFTARGRRFAEIVLRL